MLTKYYRALGLAVDASESEVRRAYRRLVKSHHPDRGGRDLARFQEIQEAYERLLSPQKHRAPGVATEVADEPPSGPYKATLAEVQVEREAARQGGALTLKVPIYRTCPACDGAGKAAIFSCKTCAGKGRVLTEHQLQPAFPPGIADGDWLRVSLDDIGLAGEFLLVQFRLV